jgi:ADP-heptose:LPS heptosyltransferase
MGMHALFMEQGGVGPQLQSLLHLTAPKMILSFLTDTSHDIHQRLANEFAGKAASLDPREKPRLKTHITTQWTDALREQGVNVTGPEPARIRLDSDAKTTGKFIVIHPGSGGRAKCWPLERFMDVADALNDHEIRWMLGPAECERDPDLHARLKGRIQHRGESLIIDEDLFNAARQPAGAALYLGNDSGMTHLAAALGIRTVAVFGPTDPRVWRPLGEHVQIIAPPEPTDIINVETDRVKHICIEQMIE